MTALARPHRTSATALTTVTPAIVLSMVQSAAEHRWDPGTAAIGIHGQLTEPRLALVDADGRDVRVVFAGSVLAVREQLARRDRSAWLVVVTDRDEADLGVGVLSQLAGFRLRSPDPWHAVRQRFRAATVDARLTSSPEHRQVALGLLETMPPTGWSPAPAGVLTRDHAFGALAQRALDLPSGAVDLVSVLGWSTRPGLTGRWAALRASAGDPLTDGVASWLADACGAGHAAVRALLLEGRISELVPLGLVVDALMAPGVPPAEAALALAHLAHRWGGPDPAVERSLRALAPQASLVVVSALADARVRAQAEQAVAEADRVAEQAGALEPAARSTLLRAGLRRRLLLLADALRRWPQADLTEVEQAHRALREHRLAATDARTPAFVAAVRIVRWLAALPDPEQPGSADLAALAVRQLRSDGWLDAAVNDVAAGADDDDLGTSLEHVLGLARTARDRHDREFAHALAAQTATSDLTARRLEHDGSRVLLLERLLPDVVLPLTRRLASQHQGVLLLVLDGLSTAVSVELLADLLEDGAWQELLLDGADSRSAGLAVLPSLTEVSRTSLLCGELRRGQQDAEREGYQQLTTTYGVGAALFHKRELDTVRTGFSLSDEVRSAIDDVDGRPLVTCVLNTIDDALDRSDPAGTHWGVEQVKHLRPLLDRARETSRTVLITADHGHVVERRQGRMRPQPDGERKTRYRAPTGPVEPDEVLVEGVRVLAPDQRAVLAVDERLRYGPLKAGYHGGAAPAEVVVPVVALVPSEQAGDPALRLAPAQEPAWWSAPFEPTTRAVPFATARPPEPARPTRPTQPPTLFDAETDPTTGAPGSAQPASFGRQLVATPVYTDQTRVAGRLALTIDQVVAVLDALLADGGRLGPDRLAQLLRLQPARVRGAVEQLARLLNVEGYAVLTRDTATGAVLLDETEAREQFGLPARAGAGRR